MHIFHLRCGDHWLVSGNVSSKSGALKAKADSDNPMPPIHGWHFCVGLQWFQDSKLECSRQVTEPCSRVTFKTLSYRDGTAIANNKECEGSYVLVVDMYHRGRPVSLITVTSKDISNVIHIFCSFCNMPLDQRGT